MSSPLDRVVMSFVSALALMMGLELITIVLAQLLREDTGNAWTSGVMFSAYLFLYWGATCIVMTLMTINNSHKQEYILLPAGSGIGIVLMREAGWPENLILPVLLCYLTGCIWWMLAERERHPYQPEPLV